MGALAESGDVGHVRGLWSRAVARAPSNLDAALTRFFGRDDEVTTVTELLAQHRVVSLVGAGGCGKSRLAGQVARSQLGAHQSVWFVELAGVPTGADVTLAIADALGTPENAHRTLIDGIAGAIAGDPIVLVLDNCEHVVDSVAAVVAGLVRQCPGLRLLLTSRHVVDCPGEAVFRVPPLPVGPAGSGPAVELFLDRARLGVDLSASDLDAVAQICRGLDGLPLAIELAAVRARYLSLGQILEGLGDQVQLLAAGRRGAASRHQTMEASITWSIDLLADDERELLERLSVFSGGFRLEAARAIVDPDVTRPDRVLDLLGSLADKSLVVVEPGVPANRYRVLEPIRQLAQRRLQERGAEDDARDRHCRHYAQVGSRQVHLGEDQRHYLGRIDRDYLNVGAALARCPDTPGASQAAFVCALGEYWGAQRHSADGARWCAAAAPHATPAERAEVLAHRSAMLYWLGDWDAAVEAAEAANQAGLVTGDERVRARVTALLGGLVDIEAESLDVQEPALEVLRRDPRDEPMYLRLEQSWSWLTARERGRVADMRPVLEANVRRCDELDLCHLAAMGRSRMALLDLWAGEMSTAVEGLTASVTELRDLRLHLTAVESQGLAAGLHALMGLDAEADRLARELDGMVGDIGIHAVFQRSLADVVTLFARADWVACEAVIAPMRDAFNGRSSSGRLVNLWYATALLGQGRLDEVAERLAAMPLPYPDGTTTVARLLVESRLGTARGDRLLGETILHDALRQAEPRALQAWVTAGLVFTAARQAADRGRAEDAARLIGHARQRCAVVGISLDAGLIRWYQGTAVEDTCAALGPERFAELVEEGAELTWDDMVAYVVRGRGRRRRSSIGWDSLTPTERQVVDLVAEGATNAEVAARLLMSVATVKSHLTHVFGKLGISNRAQLTAAAARRTRLSDSE